MGQAVVNAGALSTGCPHGPQGASRSEGLVHKSTGRRRDRRSGCGVVLFFDGCKQIRPGPV